MLELHYLSLVGKKLSKSWQTWALAKRRPVRLSEAPRGVFRSCVADWSTMQADQLQIGPRPQLLTRLSPLSSLVQWNGDDDGDKAIVAEVVGQPYEEIERDLTDLMTATESPLTKVGNQWAFYFT